MKILPKFSHCSYNPLKPRLFTFFFSWRLASSVPYQLFARFSGNFCKPVSHGGTFSFFLTSVVAPRFFTILRSLWQIYSPSVHMALSIVLSDKRLVSSVWACHSLTPDFFFWSNDFAASLYHGPFTPVNTVSCFRRSASTATQFSHAPTRLIFCFSPGASRPLEEKVLHDPFR